MPSPLTPPVFHILLALSQQERHGYGIMQDVAEQTAGEIQMGPGTLYGCLKRMLAAKLIEESGERADSRADSLADSRDERRRYYRITPQGRQNVRAEVQRLARALDAAKSKRLLAERKV